MNSDEKIKILKKLLFLNLKKNLFSSRTIGLCHFYSTIAYWSDFESNSLALDIPEITQFIGTESLYGYWWKSNSLIKSWWLRDRAIRKTIKFIKQNDSRSRPPH